MNREPVDMVDHAGLWVPADALPAGSEVVPAGGRGGSGVLADQLAAEREAIGVRRADEVVRAADAAEHRVVLADVRADAASARRRSRERVRDERSAAEVAGLYRRAAVEGTRARIRADIGRSAEMRALRVAMVQRGALLGGGVVLAGFAAWSTAGVQAGMVRLLTLKPDSFGWWAAWIVEPLLIAIAAGVIVVKALLRSAGGQTDWRADVAKWGALVVSIALNMLGGWTGRSGAGAAVGEALGHSVGAVGAAVVAWLIGVIVDYASKARPWDGEGVQRLADMDLLRGVSPTPPMASPTPPMAINLGEHVAVLPPGPAAPVALPQADQRLLEDTCTAIDDGALPPNPSGWAIYRRVI